MAAGYLLTGIRDLKWKFRINGLERVFNRAIVALKQENPESFNHAPECRPLSFCLAAINPGVCGQERRRAEKKGRCSYDATAPLLSGSLKIENQAGLRATLAANSHGQTHETGADHEKGRRFRHARTVRKDLKGRNALRAVYVETSGT